MSAHFNPSSNGYDLNHKNVGAGQQLGSNIVSKGGGVGTNHNLAAESMGNGI